ncbi:MAG: S8 family serine peptidase [bacterium]|nr:S8 family serine peptidase [bacterium]
MKKNYLFLLLFLIFFLPLIAKADAQESIVIKLKNSEKLYKVTMTGNEDIHQVINDFENQPQIDFVVPNNSYSIAMTPNDTFYSSQWYLSKIGAQTAWDTTLGSSDVIIAVLDTGVDIDHPDLANNIWINSDEVASNGIDDDNNGFIDDRYGWDFVDEVADPNPKYDLGWTAAGIHHGTVIAGAAAALGNNSQGIIGVASNVRIMSIRVLDGLGVGDTRDVYEGIIYAMNNGADFINLSFVGDNSDALLNTGINLAWEAGVPIFAAAGNNNINLNISPKYPVCSEHVIGVAGTNQSDVRWYSNASSGSNYGSNCIDISAPSTSFIGTVVYNPSQGLNDYYLSGWSGTSVATPLVAAAAALAKSNESNSTSTEILDRIYELAINIDSVNPTISGQMGNGRLDITNMFTEPISLSSVYKIMTGSGYGQSPVVKIFDIGGNAQSEFEAYASTFPNGLNIAAGDLDGDGVQEIVTGAGSGGSPQVRTFDQEGNPIFTPGFFAYNSNFRGGVHVATADLNGDGIDEIIAGAGDNGGPQVRTFDRYGTPIFTPGFFAYDPYFRGGVHVATGDLNMDGQAEIITGAGFGGGPHIRVFDRYGAVTLTPGFFAYDSNFRGGVFVSTIK